MSTPHARDRTRIKICGITRIDDGHAAVDAGADAIGLVFWRGTPRVVGELDIDALESAPKTYEVRAYFSKQSGGVNLAYAYSVPGAKEDFIAQTAPAADGAAEPEAYAAKEVPA